MGLLKSLICRQLHTISPELLIKDAIEEMRLKSVSSILVQEGGRLIGLLTERDIVKVVATGICVENTPIRAVMTTNIVSLQVDTLLDQALIVMDINGIRHLVVVDANDKPLGIVTHTDIVRKLEEDFFKAPRPVKEYMSRSLEAVPIKASLNEAIRKMHEKRISSIIVVDGKIPVGIITERDIVKLLQEKASINASVEQYMSAPIIQIDPTTSLFDASKLMEQHKIRHLVVWNGRGAVGLVTNTDIVRSIRDNYRSYLEKEAMRTRKILDLIHEGVVEIDNEECRIQWINKTGAALFGYEFIGDAIGKSFIDMIDEADRDVLKEDFQHLRSKNNYQCRIKLEARTITTLISYDVITDDINKRISYRILLRDVTSMIENRKKMEERLRKQKRQFQALFDNTTDAVAIFDREKKIQMANQQFLSMFEYSRDEVIGQSISSLVDRQDKLVDHIADEIFLGDTINRETCRYKKSGDPIYVLLKGGPVIVDGQVTGGYAVYADITDKKQIINDLRDSEERFRTLIESMGEGMALVELIYNNEQVSNYRFVEVNQAFEEHTGFSKHDVLGNLATEVYEVDEAPNLEIYRRVDKTRKPIKFESYVSFIHKHLRISAFSPKPGYVATVFDDITEQKQKEDKIQYLIYHDILTDVHNRAYFDKALKEIDEESKVPTCIIMADLNGLKLVNDAFGHGKGDELIKMAAKLIKEVCREEDIVARIGGDEFAVILPGISQDKGQTVIDKLKTRADMLQIEGIQLSISFGLGTKDNTTTSIFDVVKTSEVQMYNRKLMESQSAKNHLITSLLRVLEEKTGESRAHCQRVMELGVELGKAIGLSEDEQEKLRILALLHDIGNITIPENILKKPETLSDEEWTVVKKHPESGYRIVSAIPEFAFVAEYILCHHERIDGKGYPRGLTGDSIPKIAKILAVVDAFEVMTRDTAYREAMTVSEAVKELQANAGTQFDSNVVDVFIEKVVDNLNGNKT
ncbi:CBS domain-containing protein [Desulfuribacillus alkaliarsenatis]|uniref:Histidine kinase n=1 Tax=Desulfuribacillus alkaliarsenatis TaxID=766136 RepID=A0A1E5G3B4_9FIRM|nr:CBS domain-containing protein [Desulfuribacillus alkaliarsenatis]OEF97474.1 hypothetical protein BHF68_04510 [Desulfuribacillus alkaliarsenatis]